MTASGESKFELDTVVLEMVKRIGSRLTEKGAEVAHLKVLGQTLTDTAVANMVASSEDPELSLASEIKTASADLLVNARVAASPELLEGIVHEVTTDLSQQAGVELVVGNLQSFRPGKPEPTHRAS